MANSNNRNLKFVLVASILVVMVGAGVFLTLHSVNGAGSTGVRTTESLARDQQKQKAAVNDGAPYTVTMSPMGAVTFKKPPERIITGDANYNDLMVAMGRGEKIIAGQQIKNNYDGFYNQLQRENTGLDLERIKTLGGGTGGGSGTTSLDKETLYSLRPDIIHIDPVQMTAGGKWTKADVDEIAKNVGPFFANRFSRDNSYHGTEPYEYYTVWELADKVAQVYRKPERIANLKEIGDALVRTIQARLPPPEKRPKVGLIYYNTGRITTYSVNHGGFGQAQYVAVGAQDAFEGKNISTYGDAGGRGAALDLEGLIAINPDVLIMPLALTGNGRTAFESLLKLKEDPLGKRLKALENNHAYPGGTALQGPVFYIFQIEMAAKQIYPELFGKFRDDQQYPPEECLFDREAVAKILRGELDN